MIPKNIAEDLDLRKISIEDHLPYQRSFLLVDKVLEFTAHRKIVTLKNLTYTDTMWSTGHFKHRPVFPGVLLTEAVCQSSALLEALSKTTADQTGTPTTGVLCKIDMKFLDQATPGDQLHITVEKVASIGNLVKFRAEVKVDGKVYATGSLTGALLEEQS